VRKWTKSACVVIALAIVSLLAVAGLRASSHPAQAKTSTATSTSRTNMSNTSSASSTQAAPAAPAAALMTVTATPAAAPAATWTVRPGDTLTAIAAALAVPGGWHALYAANRAAIGPDPDVIRAGTTLTLPTTTRPARYTVAPGDTLTAIAAALAVPGGWRALYASNRAAIGPDPDIIRPGTTLVTPAPAALHGPAPVRPGSGKQRPAPVTPGAGQHQVAPPAPAGTKPAEPHSRPATGTGTGTTIAGAMPQWLKSTLLAAALLTLLAFLVELVLVISRRRRVGQAAPPREPATTPGHEPPAADQRAAENRAAEKTAKIIEADYERLIVTYSISDDAVYLLTPPGEDPRAVLRAARLVLPEDTYQELAGHLGVPPGWRE
jgi:LysM repeat protein